MTSRPIARTQGIFPTVGLDWTHSFLPGETGGGGDCCPSKVADPIFLTAGHRGFLSIEVVTSGLDSPLSRMLRVPAESFVVGEV